MEEANKQKTGGRLKDHPLRRKVRKLNQKYFTSKEIFEIHLEELVNR